MLTPSIGFCATPLNCGGHFNADDFENRRRDVDHVVELVADFAAGLDPLRPGDGQAVAGAAEVAGDLLGPLERRVHRPGPGGGEVVVVLLAADVSMRRELLLERSGMPLKNVISLSSP